jgi:ribosomal protein S18 acetylase RimI-like enzyme
VRSAVRWPNAPSPARACWQDGRVTLKAFRIAAAVVFVAGIATMIVTSIVSNSMGVMITTGLVTAVAAIVLLAVSSAVQGRPLGSIVDDIAAERIERRVADLVAAGADEVALRSLIRDSVRLGQRL